MVLCCAWEEQRVRRNRAEGTAQEGTADSDVATRGEVLLAVLHGQDLSMAQRRRRFPVPLCWTVHLRRDVNQSAEARA